MNKILLLAVLGIVFASGCVSTGGTGVATGPGVVIQGWESDFSQVYSEEPIAFELKVQNLGETRARNVGVPSDIIKATNRWRKFEIAKEKETGRAAALFVANAYAALRDLAENKKVERSPPYHSGVYRLRPSKNIVRHEKPETEGPMKGPSDS